MGDSHLAVLMGQLPRCALSCFTTALGQSSCGLADIGCQCTNQALNAVIESCVLSHCTIPEALNTKNITQTICGAPIRYQAAAYLPVSVTLMAIASALMLMRLGYQKFISASGLCLDDWFILVTWIVSITSSVVNHVLIMHNGLGRDMWTLSIDTVGEFLRGLYLMELCYFTEALFIKLSMIAFYLRIFPDKNIQRTLIGTAIFVGISGVVFLLSAIFQCTPVAFFWKQVETQQGRCLDIGALACAHGAVSIALDIWLLMIPLSRLRGLQMSRGKKMGVASMFLIGSFVTVISVARLAALAKMRKLTNLTWDYYEALLWSVVEVTVGIMCTCMPSLRLTFVRVARCLRTKKPHIYVYGGPDSSIESSCTDKFNSTKGKLSLNSAEKPLPRLPDSPPGQSVDFTKQTQDDAWNDNTHLLVPFRTVRVYIKRPAHVER
ncbi:hypothetical protein JX265_005193 [Neoarthrinium moseri]|uniref:CFEM domain-containing protein n=1 Tax=Neoarthrinium moseri TaxID=1658444 RepID=A0A9P9WPB8_9PEZI|nr:hypothetical protein JX265_005193 [Neoarthrinium moseri]